MTDHRAGAPAVGALAMGDFGDERCGVGSSLAAFAAREGPVEVLDPTVLGWWAFARRARSVARRGLMCAAVYPTRSTVYRRSLPLRFVLLWAFFGRRRLRLHLHEFQHLRRLLRWPVTGLLPLAGRVVVSSAGERAAVTSAWRGRVGSWCEVEVAPPTNGTPAPAGPPARPASPTGTVGVFGMRRDDKPTAWLTRLLVALGPSFHRLELVGSGWEAEAWAPAVTDRFEVVRVGHVHGDRLADVFAGWDLALAPFSWPAHDGRMSLRTPLAHGVPTVSVGPFAPDLTLRPPHLALIPPSDLGRAPAEVLGADPVGGAAAVARFEEGAARQLREALFGAPRSPA